MNGKNLFVDTNIIIYLIDGDETVENLLDGKNLYLSFITKIELLSFQDLNPEEERIIQGLLDHTKITFADDRICSYAIDFRQKYSLKIPDALIAASAVIEKLPLLTADKEFSQIEEIEIVQYELS